MKILKYFFLFFVFVLFSINFYYVNKSTNLLNKAVLSNQKFLANLSQKVLDLKINYQTKFAEQFLILKFLKKKLVKQQSILKMINFDNRILKANVYILNKTLQVLGSGMFIKYNAKIYILTARHLIHDRTDSLFLVRENKKEYPLQIVKVGKFHDLMLLKCNYKPKAFVEISDAYPNVGDIVFVVGNPDGERTVVTTGILSKINENDDSDYYFVGSFFGNSGGAVIYKNKLVGIVSYVVPFCKFVDYKNLIAVTEHLTGIINLKTIKQFLEN